MKTSTLVGVVIVLAVLIGGWYWWSGMQSGAVPSYGTQQPAGNPAPEPVTTTNTSTYNTSTTLILNINSDTQNGQYLSSSNGMALYTYSKDAAGVSNCSGICATNWPPYSVAAGAALSVAPGVTGTVATITRANGTVQVTHNGMPLYLWVRDAKPGDVTGDNVNGFLLAKP